MLEKRHFTIFTDHKPITYAFQRKRGKFTLQQFNQLDFVAQFTTDISHISRHENVVADPLSRVESVIVPPSYNALAASQNVDDELRTLLGSTTALQLEELSIPGTTVSSYCDTSAGRSRANVPGPLRCQVFQSVHDLSHPSTKATAKLVVLCGEVCRRIAAPWDVTVSPTSAPKFSATQLTPLGDFTPPAARFLHVHLDSWGPFQHQQATHTVSLQSTASPVGQNSCPSRASQPTPLHAPY
jgi:hypothetical protein